MFIIKGKYNSAHVMIDGVEETCIKQIQEFCNNEAFEGGRIAIMPDCHAGKGSCIGFTQPVGNTIIPNIVGVDIGCGMLAYPIQNVDFQLLDGVKT